MERTQHALDHFRDSRDFMAPWNDQRLRDRRIYSYPSCNRNCRGFDSHYPRPKTAISIWVVQPKRGRGSVLMKLMVLLGIALIVLGVAALERRVLSFPLVCLS